MKIRQSFVTNSSSSSFIVSREDLDEEGVELELRRILSLYNEMVDTDYKYEDCFGSIYKYSRDHYLADQKQIKKYSTAQYTWDGYGYEEEHNIGKIFITSNGDNSIPYELFDIIEKKFNAERFHLG